jgi:hypothetical protein
LKQKANKIALSELWEVLTMKAYIENQKMKYGRAPELRGSPSSSSTGEWRPFSPMEALIRFQISSAQPAANVFCFVQTCASVHAACEPGTPEVDEA